MAALKITAFSLARLLHKATMTRKSTGYTHPPMMDGESASWFTTTTQGRRFMVTVREVSEEEELTSRGVIVRANG